jgi:hypothetical protein
MRYVAEANRVIGDNIRAVARRLTCAGLPAYTIAHKTTLVIERPSDMTGARFKALIRSILQPRRGSIILFSEATGRTFLCSNVGNRPGLFQIV